MEKVVLFGASKFASDAYIFLTYDSPFEVVAFTVDSAYIKEEVLFERPIVPFENVESIFPPDEFKMLIALGYQRLNKLRAEKYHQAKGKGYQLINYVSSKAVTWPGFVVGDNCQIGPHAVIAPSAKIGNNVLIGAGSIIPHYAVIKDHCFLGSNVVLSGGVNIEPYCFLGTSATIRDNVTIARECVIGAGALILEDTLEKGVYMGISADRLPISSDKLPLVRQD
jgi:sugar O-acyltransferase (sialic acid O-acetyltransferase NeuD family)